jgi:hypothetical protein
MRKPIRRALFWTPRVLGVLFAVFISLFVLDVFGAGYGFWETIATLLIHLIPTAIVLVVLAIAWRWEWMGAILFVGLGLWYIIMAWGRFEWITYLLIASPLFLVGALFLANWLVRSKLRSAV